MKVLASLSLIYESASQRLPAGKPGFPGARRMSEFETLMTFYNPSFTLDTHGQYGCKCQYMVTDRPLSAGPAGPVSVDELDATCQAHKDCYRCAKEKWGESCIPEFNNYKFEYVGDEIECTASAGSCNRFLFAQNKPFNVF